MVYLNTELFSRYLGTSVSWCLYCVAVAGMKATVIYTYDADQDDELSLAVGDVIHVIDQVRLLIYLST